MKNITIREMSLLNFKGINDMRVTFDPRETSLRGRNGSGKTTVFDAFTWLLFGKDSNDRKDFNIRTLDADGKVIEKLPHEVTATIITGGQIVTLRKCFVEKWVKKRGSAVEEYDGNKTEQYVNDVPCSATEYNRKIVELFTTEEIFKLITNPMFFPTQKKDFQRTMLFRMAGDVTNDEMVELHPEFSCLVGELTGKTLEEYKRELAAKKRRIKADMENIPARIDERKRDMPEEEDWASIETEIQAKKKAIIEVEDGIVDRSKAYKVITAKREQVAKTLSECKTALSCRTVELKDQIEREYNEKLAERRRLTEREDYLMRSRKYDQLALEKRTYERNELNAQRDELLQDWRDIKAGVKPVFDPNSFVCPTCHRPFDTEDIESKKKDIIANMFEENKRKGLSVKTKMENVTAEITSLESEIFSIDQELAQIRNSEAYTAKIEKPYTEHIIIQDKEVIKLSNRIKDCYNQLQEEVTAPDTSDLQNTKRELETAIRELEARLRNRETIEATKKRIETLESEYKTMSEELTILEGKEYAIAQFRKAQIEHIEERINGMFRMVRWKMFETQINGGEVETCECTIDGVPFSDLNTAGKINAGLDIINAIQKCEGITAPVFIDNRESVTEIADLDGQIVNLIVDENYLRVTVA